MTTDDVNKRGDDDDEKDFVCACVSKVFDRNAKD